MAGNKILCLICGMEHDPGEPHDARSIIYIKNFREAHGRMPTWSDALSHCTEEVKKSWRDSIRRVRENTEKISGPFPEGFWE